MTGPLRRQFIALYLLVRIYSNARIKPTAPLAATKCYKNQ